MLYESKLDMTINDHEVHIQGYDILRKDRNRVGGVAINIRSIINIAERRDLVSGDLAALCVEIVIPKSKPFLIASWYRSPNTRLYEPQNQLEKF